LFPLFWKDKTMDKFRKYTPWFVMALIVAVLVGAYHTGQATAQLEGVTNLNGVHLSQSSFGTATPQLLIQNQGSGRSFEIRDTGGTPEAYVNADGSMTINALTVTSISGGSVLGYPTPGIRLNCKSNTITDTASYTATVTAISTPQFALCTLSDVTGDANTCGAAVGSGIVTITVKNAAATPAANSAGATVHWCAGGTPN
jgi:hypothetical protein